MNNIYKIEKNRYRFFNSIIEFSWRRAFGVWLEFKCQDWQIVLTIGFIFGKVYINFDHKFLYKNFKKVFWGKGFGEWGREIGFMIESKYKQYSLWWYSDLNRPPHKWRTKVFLG